ncbi:hypothetical protein MJN76_33970, partial [Salmonella enterica subsp. enterica serovar Anatum]|nr:hypothetical protein [Salmonella enterica subsp. enterica serovar Anatum]
MLFEATMTSGYYKNAETNGEGYRYDITSFRVYKMDLATRRQPLIPGWLIPGLCAAALMITVSLAAFLALWLNAPSGA